MILYLDNVHMQSELFPCICPPRLPSGESQDGPNYNPRSGVLTLTNAQTGLYTCTGVNEFGSSSVSTEITIITTPGKWSLLHIVYCMCH